MVTTKTSTTGSTPYVSTTHDTTFTFTAAKWFSHFTLNGAKDPKAETEKTVKWFLDRRVLEELERIAETKAKKKHYVWYNDVRRIYRSQVYLRLPFCLMSVPRNNGRFRLPGRV